MCLVSNTVLRLGLLALFGPWALAGNLLGSIGAFIAPLLVNSICHMPKFGYQNYATTDLSQNVWFVALASFGEGWHNNHHKFPQSARHGLRPIEFDFSWSVLSVLKALGLAKNIRLPKDPALAGTNAEGAEVQSVVRSVVMAPPAVADNETAPTSDASAREEAKEPASAGTR